jgi:hypothetical protein
MIHPYYVPLPPLLADRDSPAGAALCDRSIDAYVQVAAPGQIQCTHVRTWSEISVVFPVASNAGAVRRSAAGPERAVPIARKACMDSAQLLPAFVSPATGGAQTGDFERPRREAAAAADAWWHGELPCARPRPDGGAASHVTTARLATWPYPPWSDWVSPGRTHCLSYPLPFDFRS